MPELENSPENCGSVGRKRKKRFMKKIVFAVLLSVLASADICSKEFVIARNGKALVSVVENPLVKNAQEYLVQEAGACGVDLKVVSSSFPGKKILFKVKRSVSVLQEDAYSITFPDDDREAGYCMASATSGIPGPLSARITLILSSQTITSATPPSA